MLFKENFTALTGFARKYVKDIDTSKEITHDVFINLWEKRNEIDSEKPLRSYLFTSVRNRCLNYIRDHKKFDKTENITGNPGYSQLAEDSDPVQIMELEERINLVIDSLPDKCREIFIMNRFRDLKYAEIAKKLDISVKTVEGQMSRALKTLREKLATYLPVWVVWVVSIFSSIWKG
ncbi:MAG: RNA polymerase sigma-70 factor [Bacteroidetes bacterium]|nr:RNA polymerase sigma-70 factor [Bacteroidota bacterium]